MEVGIRVNHMTQIMASPCYWAREGSSWLAMDQNKEETRQTPSSAPIRGTHISHGSPLLSTLCLCEPPLDSPINSSFLPQLIWVGSQTSVGSRLTQLLCGFHTDTRIHACSVSGYQKIQMCLHNNHTSVLLDEEENRTLCLGSEPQGQ